MTQASRRRFGRGLGAALLLIGLPTASRARQDAREAEVRIARLEFHPTRIEIAAGDSITWVNEDIAPHTATAVDGEWDTGPLGQGDAARIRFDRPGVYPYACAFHPHMVGTVVVLPGSGGGAGE